MLIEVSSEVIVERDRILSITEDASNDAVITFFLEGGSTATQTVVGKTARQVHDIVRAVRNGQ